MNAVRIILAASVVLALAACTREKLPEPPPPAESTNAIAKPVPKMFPAVMATFTGNEGEVLEQRYSLGDELEIRYGPGRLYPVVPDAQALKGSRIFVLEEKDGWLRFRNARTNGVSAGWINKFASIPTEAADASVHKKDVDLLMGLGVLVHIDPLQSDASVSTNLWNEEGLTVQKGMGRSIAYYCADIRGRSTRWVDIRDSSNGRKIAKYSDNLGFSSYLQDGTSSRPARPFIQGVL